ncbi:bifunctional diaminohydroxyphosphoribosylaminopyrimidine deaminase/5-amino-6-(5-phosphoribosylamino)uracil reductase RibD [Amnibacterium sp. CER49]|uniref:bifunctional diaminohydroxyphosphoribosylaminopyrimidine deaminase/5-amino-6-(5-phosphoribosylamino)uracil reductase RibD n=1 Tax=Amnibacterium sp. CER49 TaxID=3039161 RepID=UPI00244CDF0F|nr:bifunctional diaminohydroxyphosphoribosylaminopyrimidine deaminase/5-amino-6-(5-phosphoribosylamino)uracil reductase RibD [Amnibacterium sp. CER49]MDH2443132.1 bifunctional diaminohydroxyphosphoribosylaminopyrimidine deaminase/5-amino-6-(5-phosphoribosylamino)uracil reductase RibD [Amnibacterium sp. CER49]
MTTTGTTTTVEQAMRRALELAALGPAGGPNPQVGCVLLSADGEVLAEGYHRGAGTPHAEVDALSRLPEGAARGATAVVTLEPCNHTGRTGPCAVALIEAGVARVVFATRDPLPLASGGAARLRAAGVAVEEGLLADAADALNERWRAAIRLGRPWVTAKWGSSLDGRIAAADGTSRWITGPEARADVHRRRAQHGAIVVGTGTALADDPALTARGADGLLPAQPLPVVVGRRDVPGDAAVRRHPRPLLQVRRHEPAAVLAALAEQGVTSAFLEGGPTLVSAFLAAGLVDEVLVYLAPTLLGGSRLATTDLGVATIADQLRLDVREVRTLGTDVLVAARPHPAGTP